MAAPAHLLSIESKSLNRLQCKDLELNPIAKQGQSGLISAKFLELLLPPKRSKLVNGQSRVQEVGDLF
jgi:hypothetical protein